MIPTIHLFSINYVLFQKKGTHVRRRGKALLGVLLELSLTQLPGTHIEPLIISWRILKGLGLNQLSKLTEALLKPQDISLRAGRGLFPFSIQEHSVILTAQREPLYNGKNSSLPK